jgi:hypothetical protein
MIGPQQYAAFINVHYRYFVRHSIFSLLAEQNSLAQDEDAGFWSQIVDPTGRESAVKRRVGFRIPSLERLNRLKNLSLIRQPVGI